VINYQNWAFTIFICSNIHTSDVDALGNKICNGNIMKSFNF